MLTVDRLEARFVYTWVPCKLKYFIFNIFMHYLEILSGNSHVYSIEQKEHLNRSLWEILFLGCYVHDCSNGSITEKLAITMVSSPTLFHMGLSPLTSNIYFNGKV